MPIVKFFYATRKNDDGSVAVDFYTDMEAAQLACDIELKAGRALPNNKPQGIELEFNDKGVLISPDATKEELQEKLIKTPVAPPPSAIAEQPVANDPATRQFWKAAQPPAPPQPSPADKIDSIAGKVVAFTGKLSMSRPRLKQYAAALGARVAGSVTENTDILVIGEEADAGIKLERAQEHGTIVITEEQWMALARRASNQPKPGF